MSRVIPDMPENFYFSCTIPVRITDINYGGHVGNDMILSLLHEARMQFLRHHGFTEMEFAGVGMIMAGVCIEFKSELFYGDLVNAAVVAGVFTRVGFDLFYKLATTRQGNDQPVIIAFAKTTMICYDYEKKRIVSVPGEAREKLAASPPTPSPRGEGA